MSHGLTIGDLHHPLTQVARSLPQWDRGDINEAVAITLDLSARNAHARAYVAWHWRVGAPDGVPVWLAPVSAGDAEAFSPRGPVHLLLRTMFAAAVAGAHPTQLELFDWDGFVAIRAPGTDDELMQIALTESHPSPAAAPIARAPLVADGPALELVPPRTRPHDGIGRLAGVLRTHPLAIAPTLLEQGWTLLEEDFPDAVADLLAHRGFRGSEPVAARPSLAIEDDVCPRRRFARRLLRRLLHKRKVGDQYHTAFDHLAHGVAPEGRADAYAIGEALLRAGLLGEKPSNGQRHVFLRREALPQIHALIERGLSDPPLNGEWTAPPPK